MAALGASFIYVRTVGHLLHKRPELCLTYLETEVTGPLAFPRGNQADWKPEPKHLTCLPHLGEWAHLIRRKMAPALASSSAGVPLGAERERRVGVVIQTGKGLGFTENIFPDT